MNSNILLSKLRTAGIKSVDSGKIKTFELKELIILAKPLTHYYKELPSQ